MGGELSFFLVVLAPLLDAHWLEDAVYRQLDRLTARLVPSKIRFQADGDDGSNRSSNRGGTSFR